MINFYEIQPGDLVRVLVNIEDDIEDELYATVKENNEDYLVVSYYSETSLTYKCARLYELDETKDELVQEMSLSLNTTRPQPISKTLRITYMQ